MHGSGGRNLHDQFSHDVGSHLVFHVHGYVGCAPFSKEMTCGWGQVVELLGFVVQVLEMAGWSVQPWLLNIEVLDIQACHIYSTSWEDFHKLCLAKWIQFSHVLGAGWSCLVRHILAYRPRMAALVMASTLRSFPSLCPMCLRNSGW